MHVDNKHEGKKYTCDQERVENDKLIRPFLNVYFCVYCGGIMYTLTIIILLFFFQTPFLRSWLKTLARRTQEPRKQRLRMRKTRIRRRFSSRKAPSSNSNVKWKKRQRSQNSFSGKKITLLEQSCVSKHWNWL